MSNTGAAHSAEKVVLLGEQEQALQELLDWWNLPKDHEHYYSCVLSAPAGTGKTFLTKHFTKQLQSAEPLFTATTHEAVNQLNIAGVPARTVHSALGLVPVKQQETLRFQQLKLPDDLSNYNLLVVDEASMADKAEHVDDFDEIIDYVIQSGMRVLWLGDAYQLPPASSNTSISPVFLQGYKTVTLTTVIRNSGDILDFCTALRSTIDSSFKRLPRSPKGINEISLKKFLSTELTEEILEKFHSGEAKSIVWRNASADYLNTRIRERIFRSDSLPRFVVTDRILLTTPLLGGAYPDDAAKLPKWGGLKIMANVNAGAEVLSCETADLYNIRCYKLKLRFDTGTDEIAFIPTPEGEAKLDAYKRQIVKRAATLSGAKKAELWEQWHSFASCFTRAKHSYAITTHRAQGATIPHVYVYLADMFSGARDLLLLYKLLYTACSRARTSLTLIKD